MLTYVLVLLRLFEILFELALWFSLSAALRPPLTCWTFLSFGLGAASASEMASVDMMVVTVPPPLFFRE